MQRIFDAHAHYDDKKFDADREGLLASLPEKGVCGIINAGSDLESSEKSIELAARYPFVYAAAGIHPHEAQTAPADYLDRLRVLLKKDKVVALGEIGLDYHYDFSPRNVQRKVFREQLMLARELSLPVVIHDREAHGDTYSILHELRPAGLVHCFSGSVELLDECISCGLYISLGGAVTFKNAKTPLEVAKAVPLERLLLETDAPYMSPVPHRGERCDSSMILLTAQKIAEVRAIDVDLLLSTCEDNARRLFSI